MTAAMWLLFALVSSAVMGSAIAGAYTSGDPIEVVIAVAAFANATWCYHTSLTKWSARRLVKRIMTGFVCEDCAHGWHENCRGGNVCDCQHKAADE